MIKNIQEQDDTALAKIIRAALEEFKANKPGTVYYDETTDHLSRVFMKQGSAYFTVFLNENIVGGSGIYPTDNLPHDTCELVKMYLSPLARGKGLGRMLMQKCLQAATELGYKKVYLETMPELINAIPMYEKFGFNYLPTSMGNSGHTGCGLWMIKELEADTAS
ncbi:MAG: GNAT family N-acetyltransferase [Ferruginibacter sp.]